MGSGAVTYPGFEWGLSLGLCTMDPDQIQPVLIHNPLAFKEKNSDLEGRKNMNSLSHQLYI